MQKTYYLDWRPRASHAVNPTAFAVPVLAVTDYADYASQIFYPKEQIEENVATVTAHARTDGIFIFAIDWKDQVPGRPEQYDIVSVIAHCIKGKLGHSHIYDQKLTSVVRYGGWTPVQKFPVKLYISPEQATKELSELISTDAALLELRAAMEPDRGSAWKLGDTTPAVLWLRDKYTRLFDNTFEWTEELRATKIAGLPIYNQIIFFPVLYLVLISAVAIHLLEFSRTSDVSYGTVLLGGFLNAFAWVLAFGAVAKIVGRVIPISAENLSEAIRKQLSFAKEGHISKWQSAILKYARLGSARQWICLWIIPGTLVCALREVPSLLRMLKLEKVGGLEGWFENLNGAISQMSIIDAINRPQFFSYWVDAVLFYLPPLLIVLYTLEISLKRRRIMEALRLLRGSLLFGNILNAVVDGVFYRAKKGTPKDFDYGSAISIVDDCLSLERRKRTRAQLWLGGLMLLSFAVSYPAYMTLIFENR